MRYSHVTELGVNHAAILEVYLIVTLNE